MEQSEREIYFDVRDERHRNKKTSNSNRKIPGHYVKHERRLRTSKIDRSR